MWSDWRFSTIMECGAQRVNDPTAILNRMMGYVPDLQRIWVGTTDDQLIALSNEFPGFYRYALIMEEASEAERKKVSRPYDGMAPFSEQQKQLAAQLLTTAATVERGYQALLGGANRQVVQLKINEMDKLHRQWLSDLERFKSSLREQGAEPMALEYVNKAFGRLAERIEKLAG